MRVTSEEAHQEVSRTDTAYHYRKSSSLSRCELRPDSLTSVFMVILIQVIAASIAFSNSAAFSTDDNDAGGYVHDSDPSDEGHALSGGSEQPAAPRDSEPVTEVRPSIATRGGSRNTGSKRNPEGTDNSASSATDAERGGQEGPGSDDGETL